MTKKEIKERIDIIISNKKDNITADEIYDSLLNKVDPGRTQETIRKYIREMVNSGEYLIGSSNKGYFKITSKKEVLNAIKYLENRIPNLQTRAKTLKQKWNNNNPNNKI